MKRLEGIYVILDADIYGETLLDAAKKYFDAGIRLAQYRAKSGVDPDVLKALLKLRLAAGATLIVNDDVEAAMLADGIHLGQEDLALHDTRALRALFPGKIFGVSLHQPEQTKDAAWADYFGVGPLHQTSSKNVEREPLGLAGVAAVIHATTIPVCAIGGVAAVDVPQLRAAGAAMAACIGALAHAPDRGAAARALQAAWDNAAARV